MMNVLITNDDGINARGLYALSGVFERYGSVTVCAPTNEQSGVSVALTIRNILRVQDKSGFYIRPFALDGTPCDCVKFALSELFPKQKPDFVISGVNRGPNNAINSIYSGTVGAAIEGAINGIPSVAVSLTGYNYNDYSVAAEFTADFLTTLKEHKKLFKFREYRSDDKEIKPIPNGECAVVYNINVPPLPQEKIKGVKITSTSTMQHLIHYEKRQDPFNRDYYWLDGFSGIDKAIEGSDDEALNAGYISVSPLKVDRTDYEHIKVLKKIESKLWR